MRIRSEERLMLKEYLKKLSTEAKIYLFGSRVDDTKKGGDIDLLIVSKKLSKKDIRSLRIKFFEYFGEQKLDIILDDGSFENPFHKLISKKAIAL